MLNLINSVIPVLAQADPNSSLQEQAKETLKLGQVILTKCADFLTAYGFKIVGAILILIIGRMAAGFLSKLVNKAMTKAKQDPLLISFTENLSYVGMMVFVVLAALGILKIPVV